MLIEPSIINSKLLVLWPAVLSIFWLPIVSGRNLENSKNELSDNIIAGVNGGSEKINNQYYAGKHNLRSMLGSPKDYQQKIHSKIPLSLDLMDFLLEYEDEDRSKRYDDYGHMRFGKRGGEEQFDDYGHMRFGRSA